MSKRMNRALLAVLSTAFIAWAAVGCGDSTVSGPSSQGKASSTQSRGPLPPAPVRGPADDVVQGFIDAWNDSYGANVAGVGYRYKGTIDDDAELQQVIDGMSDPNTAYAPAGWADEPTKMSALPLSQQDYDAAEYLTYVSDRVGRGQHYYVLNWQTASGSAFDSYFTSDGNGAPIFGNMYSLTLFDPTLKVVPGVFNRDSVEACADFDVTKTLKSYWAWPLDDVQRGEASLTIHVECDCEGEDCITTDEDITDVVEDMNLGSANAEAEWITDEHGNREVLVGLTTSTCTADVEIEFDAENAKVKFKATGLGSSLKRKYNVSADCDGTCPKAHEATRVQFETINGRH